MAARALPAANAAAGENVVTLSAKQLGRRAGLYRLTAAAVPGGAVQLVGFRIRRAR